MRVQLSLLAALAPALGTALQGNGSVGAVNEETDVKYVGFQRNGVDVFLNIPYGQDTGGEFRFKPPRPYVPTPGSTINATSAGPACPQSLGEWFPPLTLENITHISENCLNLNVVRPKAADVPKGKKLPVMVWIHGGSFWAGSNQEPTHQPDGLVLESIKGKNPVIHVAMNYRLGFFGFAFSDALNEEGSTNAGLRDQRLAIEWVRDNIEWFGGDPENITIFGQSSGGLAVGFQLLAYGGTKPVPYQRGIAQSQALGPGITGTFTIDAMDKLVKYIGCGNSTSLHSPATISCLRRFDTQTLYNASLETYVADIGHNIGDIWLPSVDGDFVPDAPSTLIKEGRFAKTEQGEPVVQIFGWTNDDVNFFTDTTITTANETETFLHRYISEVPLENLRALLDLYPVAEFSPPAGATQSAEFYRTARVFRDILMVCQPLFIAQHLQEQGNDIYFFDFNQTVLEPLIEAQSNVSKIGVIHTSEFPYIYGNLSFYEAYDAYAPTESDQALLTRASRSWSSFATSSNPSAGNDTLQGWDKSFTEYGDINIFVIGGPSEGFSTIDGPHSSPALGSQRLRERCGLLNSDDFIDWLNY